MVSSGCVNHNFSVYGDRLKNGGAPVDSTPQTASPHSQSPSPPLCPSPTLSLSLPSVADDVRVEHQAFNEGQISRDYFKVFFIFDLL